MSKITSGKIYRPAISTLEAIVSEAKNWLELETYQRLEHLYRTDLLKKLDEILETESTQKAGLYQHSKHHWLCSFPVSNTAKEFVQVLAKIDFLQEIGVHLWDLSRVSENRKKQLAHFVRHNSIAHIKRLNTQRRYPSLICFLRECLIDYNDILLPMYGDYWQQMNNKAKRQYETYVLEKNRNQKQAIKTASEALEMLMDESIEQQTLRDIIYQRLSKIQLKEALSALNNNGVLKDNHLYFLRNYYPILKQFSPSILTKIDFKIAFAKDNFEAALILVKDLQTGKKRKIPQDSPMNFIGSSWLKLVVSDGKINTLFYELCVLSVLKDRLQSGDVYIQFSRKYTNLERLLISPQHWKINQDSLKKQLFITDFGNNIDQKIAELVDLLPQLTEKLKESTDIRLENDVLVVSPLQSDAIPTTAQILQSQINTRLPKVSLVDMIQEVDAWLNFSKVFEAENAARNSQHLHLKYAAIFGNACNLSLADLARSSDLEYQSLWWVSNNYFSEENLKKANDLLVNFHYKQWISAYWGGGTLSSSDGQRFPTSGKVRNAKALPKYFGYNQGVTIYTHTADQYSQFGSRIVGVTERDATYVLNEILANQTDLPLSQHTTDTHGYTDLNFALFDLVGKQFAPRIRDLKSQRLYKIVGTGVPQLEYPLLNFTGNVNIDYLKRHLEEMTRVTASLKSGTVAADTLIRKLQAYPRQNNLMYVLQSYGQLVKTCFICRFLLDKPLRKTINAQLNKGEQLHGLRAYLWFGGDGVIRKKQEQEQQITARSLNILTNIIIVWNTVYIQEILKQLQKEGLVIDENDLEYISPTPFEHINRLGKYTFNTDFEIESNGLRPLRNSLLN